MDFETTFPVRYWINLGRRADRRAKMEARFDQAGLTVERFPAVDAKFVRRMALERNKEKMPGDSCDGVRGYENAGRYALALSQRLAIRRAKHAGASAVLIFEDDAILHPNFNALIAALELPENWGICYLGCAHLAPPAPAAPGVVRVNYAVDTHAFAVRAPYFDRVMQALDAHGKETPSHPLASDRFLAALHREIPTYAFFPNLAWQAEELSDLTGSRYTLYRRGGTQGHQNHIVEATFAAMLGGGAGVPAQKPSSLGLLFLTRGDVHHPGIWREFVDQAPSRVKVFNHPKVERQAPGTFLEGTEIAERHETWWGSISLVNATLALLREALQDPDLTHFVLLSESCVPVYPLTWILQHLDCNPKSRFWHCPLEKATPLQRSRAAAIPGIPGRCWHFQSQWWLLDRTAAEWVSRADFTGIFSRMPIPDEAYFATVLSLLGYPLADRVVDRPITWTHWESDVGRPTEFMRVKRETISEILDSGAWFARKFPSGSDIGSFGLHRSGAEPPAPPAPRRLSTAEAV